MPDDPTQPFGGNPSLSDRFVPGHAWLERHRIPLPSTEALALSLVRELRDVRKITTWLHSLRHAVDIELARDRAEDYRRTQE